MNERLLLFLDNVEKIRLFFGSGAESFVFSIATQLALRGKRFYGFDYDEVDKTIKGNSKWYSTVRHSRQIANAYYVHYDSDLSMIPKAIERQKQIQFNKFKETEDSYLASIYIEDGQVTKLEELTLALEKQLSLRFESLSLPQRALLSTRPECPIDLAETCEKYYQMLISRKWKRGFESRNAAFLLTLETGAFQESISEKVNSVESIIRSIHSKLEPRHYIVICLLALVDFNKTQLNDLLELENTICKKLKLNPKYYNTLMIATQLYTSNGVMSSALKYYTDFADIVMDTVEFGGGDSSGDGGGGD